MDKSIISFIAGAILGIIITSVISFEIDINPYDESVRAFENYLDRYPNSTRKKDVYQYLINVLAALFVVLRVIYIGLYIANLATLRTVVWVSAIGCSVGMFLISI